MTPIQLQQQCVAGDAAACYKLGLLYAKGKGVEQSEARAAVLFGKACDAGMTEGCFDLGVLYANGEGVVENKTQAFAHWRKALLIDPHHAKARHNLSAYGEVP